MKDAAQRRLLLTKARDDLLERGSLEAPGIPSHVAGSWLRSTSHGVPPHNVTAPYDAELDFDSRLAYCARPVIEQLAQQVAGVPVSLALTDARARILTRHDSDSMVGRILDRVFFAQGFDYAETAVGTNGVGTALEFGGSVHIVGAEHFVDSLQAFACAGAPVHNPLTGRVEGVLDVTCLSQHSTPLMHSLARWGARQIENNLLQDRDPSQRALFDAYSRLELRSRHAVLAVGPQIVMANSAMQSLLGHRDQEALQDHLRFVMQRHRDIDHRVDLPSGARVRLRGSVIRAGESLAGMVVAVSSVPEGEGCALPQPPRHADRPLPAGPEPTPQVEMSLSPSWRAAAATVKESLRSGKPVLVLGEAGSGRLTLLSRLFGLVYEEGHTVAMSAQEVEQAPEESAARLLQTPSCPTLLVLRDLDRLSEPTLHRLLAAWHSSPHPPALAATASEAVVGHAGHPSLLAVFLASATVPPLRHRRCDLPALVTSLLAALAPHREVRLSEEALCRLGAYPWPGNLPELERALSQALARRPVGVIETHDLPTSCQSVPRHSLRPVDDAERDLIVKALRDAHGNRVAAAATLGIARSTLYRKIHHYGITL